MVQEGAVSWARLILRDNPEVVLTVITPVLPAAVFSEAVTDTFLDPEPELALNEIQEGFAMIILSKNK